MKWSIAKARQRFSELLESAVREPQPIYKRDRLVAAVVDAETFAEFLRWKEERATRSTAEALGELRALCEKERYEFEWPDREDRLNPFTTGSEP